MLFRKPNIKDIMNYPDMCLVQDGLKLLKKEKFKELENYEETRKRGQFIQSNRICGEINAIEHLIPKFSW